MENNITIQDRARGMLAGLAIGDALGAPIQFMPSGRIIGMIHQIRKMQDRNGFPKGYWTDDTSMALCLADSLLECGGYDSYDVMGKYSAWKDKGYRSCVGAGFGIGTQTMLAINSYEENPELTDDQKTESAGNGAIMRLAPVIIATHNKPNLKLASVSARDTHYSVEAEAVAEMFASILYAALQGKDKEGIFKALDADFSNPEYEKVREKIKPALSRVDDHWGDSLKDLDAYCVDSLTIALWGLKQYEKPLYGMLGVISLGGDTDTNAAIYGQLAGAYYGYEAFPEEWREDVFNGEEIVKIADKLFSMKECPILRTRFK
ncbi:MAG: ADP-ribosylglycohydrolase family protein [Candidatus Saccharibacteria bacterium]|nr:ADP-ribosylglycohydrolase family protein [Candidatus Saccharibacteria bacterium]